jgi:hypothetical protein
MGCNSCLHWSICHAAVLVCSRVVQCPAFGHIHAPVLWNACVAVGPAEDAGSPAVEFEAGAFPRRLGLASEGKPLVVP